MKLEDLRVYQISMRLGELIWNEVSGWSYFEKDTVGKQFARATDSISANIAEGFGRYHYKQNKLFLYYARGSYFETISWFHKAVRRGLISEADAKPIREILDDFSPRLNNYIRSIGSKDSVVREDTEPYDVTEITMQNHDPCMTSRSDP